MNGNLPSHSRCFVTGSQKCATAINKEEEIMSKTCTLQNQTLGFFIDSLNRSAMYVRSQPVQLLMNESLGHLSNKVLEIFVHRARFFHPSFLDFFGTGNVPGKQITCRWSTRAKNKIHSYSHKIRPKAKVSES